MSAAAAAADAQAAVAVSESGGVADGGAGASQPSKSLSVDPSAVEGGVLGGLHRWLSCICVITFDLELGPSLEYCYPPEQLSQAEATNVCGLAFPDSHCNVMGDLSFCFRMRANPKHRVSSSSRWLQQQPSPPPCSL
jgi:hypothetical protein